MTKKLIATLLTAALVVANVMPVMAEGVNGAGAVEYDNSVDVTYDSIQVPTLTASKYDFTLDPTDLLYTYNKTKYAREAGEKNPGVYFHSQKTGASIAEKVDENSDVVEELFTLSQTEVAAGAADWTAVVTAVTDDDDKTPTVTPGYYVWTPAAFASGDYVAGTTPTGKKGVFTELTADNIENYFEISEKDAQDKYTISIKEDHLSGDSVCDGKLYKDTYTDLTAIVDNPPTVSLGDYVTLASDGETIASVKNVWKVENDEYELAGADDIAFTPAVVIYQGFTDKVVVTNKSTNKKTVKAVVTVSNIDGLTFRADDTFTGDDTASVYFNATDGTKDAVLEQGEATATATYTTDIGGADVKTSQILYQGADDDKNALGGHNYYNYEANGTTYNSNAFYIEAKANTEGDAAEAWATYGANATAAPSINIVYTVEDYEEPASTFTVTYKANGGTGDDQTEDVAANGTPNGPETAFGAPTGQKLAGWSEDEDGDAAELGTFTITQATTLYAIWEDDVKTGTLELQKINNKTYATVKGEGGADLAQNKLTAYAINGTDVLDKALFYNGLYGVLGADLIAAGVDVSGELTATYTVDGVKYTATYTPAP